MADLSENLTGIGDLADIDFLSVLSALDEGVIISDRHGQIIFYNDQQAQIDDLDAGEVVGRNVLDIYNLEESSSKIMRCIASGKPILGELFFYRTRLGKVANTIHSVFPLMRKGRVVGAVCFVKDYNILEKTIISSSDTPSDQAGAKRQLGNGTRYRFTDIVGSDDKVLQAVKIARLAADTPSPVMLCGETGTGKELFAQSIHNYSARSNNRFIGINCAAIPENLLEGLLFGTTKGAFTGAMDRPGIFEQAQGGTLFLDEVNAMPLNLQAKLLRALQEKKVRRVGATMDFDVDLKIISSVNKPPHNAIEEGLLRMDLFYRLGVVLIHLPPLREQQNVLGALIRHFIYKYNLSMGKQVAHVSESVLEIFRLYQWPGNIRELEHIIEGIMNFIQNEQTIELHHLPMHFISPEFVKIARNLSAETSKRKGSGDRRAHIHRNLPPTLQSFSNGESTSLTKAQVFKEITLINEALSDSRGNVSKASKRLGISRQLLHYKMKKYDLHRSMFTLPASPAE